METINLFDLCERAGRHDWVSSGINATIRLSTELCDGSAILVTIIQNDKYNVYATTNTNSEHGTLAWLSIWYNYYITFPKYTENDTIQCITYISRLATLDSIGIISEAVNSHKNDFSNIIINNPFRFVDISDDELAQILGTHAYGNVCIFRNLAKLVIGG